MDIARIFVFAFIAIGVLVGAGIALLLIRATHKDRQFKEQYDERQELVRGKGYTYGFYTMAVYELIIMVAALAGLELPVHDSVIHFTGILLGSFITSTYCIWNGANLPLNASKKKQFVLFLVLGLINLLIGVFEIFVGGLIVDGVVTFPFINLLIGVLLLAITVQSMIKNAIDSKAGKVAGEDE